MARPQPTLRESAPLPPREPPGRDPAYAWFVAGVASWFGAFGLQGVLFAQILLEVLEETPERIGFAQAASMLPPVLLLLLGGAIADRRDSRLLLSWLHVCAVVLVAGLAFALARGALTYELMLVFALTMGSVSAFVIPARDSLLSEVAGSDLTGAVAEVSIVQWSSQAVGSVLSFLVRFVGFPLALGIQAVMLLGGAGSMRRMHRGSAQRPRPLGRLRLGDLGAGVREVAASPVLRSPLALQLAIGVLFVGPFQVAIPVMVRDVYDRADLLGLFFMTFPLGTIAGSLAIRLRGGIRRKGLAQLLALGFGSVALGAVALGLPFAVALGLLCGWGFCGAIFMTASRSLFQFHATPQQRGRVLSVYTLGFMGSAPLGAALSGFLVAEIGPLATCAVSAAGMLVVVAAAAAFSNALQLE